mgnify:CR=1 FL=1|jgi:hypothetical protein
MNSMFGKFQEPLSSSERMKQKRNLEIYKSLETSNDVCLDASKNIRNVINYESYMNVVNGFYQSKKLDISNNRLCFNVELMGEEDAFKIRTFDDVNNSVVDFEGAINNDSVDTSNMGIEEFKTWDGTQFNDGNTVVADGGDDKGFVVYSQRDGSGNATTNFLQTGTIERASNIIYPYEKKGSCANLIVPKLTFFDPSGNLGNQAARDIKYFFPMSELSYYSTLCKK